MPCYFAIWKSRKRCYTSYLSWVLHLAQCVRKSWPMILHDDHSFKMNSCFSKSIGYNSVKTMLYRTQNIIWPRYSYDKYAYHISFHDVQPLQRKRMETANNWNFLSPRRITRSIVSKTLFDLDIRKPNAQSHDKHVSFSQLNVNWKL